MPSPRSVIIDAIKDALIISGVIGSYVFRGRKNELVGSTFPTTYIYPIREEITVETIGATRLHTRTMALVIDHWTRAATPELMEEAFDTAEDLIVSTVVSLTAGVAARDNILTSAEWSYDAKEDYVFGCARISFTIIYQTTH